MKRFTSFLRRICGGNGTYREEWRAIFSVDGNAKVYRGVRPHRHFGRAPLQVQVALGNGKWNNVDNSPGGFVAFVDAKENKLTTSGDLVARITDYLASGGLFNPELMEHDKVRDLLMDCREYIANSSCPVSAV